MNNAVQPGSGHSGSRRCWWSRPSPGPISVVVPAHNYAHFLVPAVESAMRQTPAGRPHEVVVVNDSSTDDTDEVVGRLQARYGNLAYFKVAFGNPNAARRYGLDRTTGEYVLFLDPDNWLAPDYLAKCRRALQAPLLPGGFAAGYAYGDRVMHYEADWFWGREGAAGTVERVRVGPFSLGRLLERNYIDMCALVRRDCVRLDEAMEWHEDWDQWLALAGEGIGGAYARGTAFHYRVHEGNRSRSGALAREDWRVRHKHRALWARVRPKKVSVIVIAKTEEEVRAKTDQLRAQDYPDFEICSSTAERFADAYQEAVNRATGDIIVFTETDVIPVSRHWLSELVAEVRPGEIVQGLTVTDQTPCMANIACFADIARRFPRDAAYGPAEDTEWLLRLQARGTAYRQANLAPVLHQRTPVRHAMLGRAYEYGRQWVRLIRKYRYYSLATLIERTEVDREIAERILKGIRDETAEAGGGEPGREAP